jgi:shikimate kinase
VVFLVPERRIIKSSLRHDDFLPIKEEVKAAFELAREGNVARAITLNGRAYAPILGVDNGPADAAIAAGAWAAGMTGTGPAIAVLVTDEASEAVLAALAPFQGSLVRTGINTAPARTLGMEEYSMLRDDVLGGDDGGQ